MIDDPRRHERKCGAYSESRCLSGAQMKHHFRSDPLALLRAAMSKLDLQRTPATVIIALFVRDGPAGNESITSTNGQGAPIRRPTRNGKATQGADGVARHSRQTRQVQGSKFLTTPVDPHERLDHQRE